MTEEQEPRGVFVGPSIWRSLDVRTATAMYAAMSMNPAREHVVWAPLWNDALIGRSRSLMCTEFLEKHRDCDVMVIIDDDIVFEPQDFWKIVEGARETRGIYGGVYVTRSTNPHIASRFYRDRGEVHIAQTPQRRPFEIQYLATGFFAIHRDVLEAMVDAEFEDAYGTHRMERVTLGADRPFYPVFSPFVCREDGGELHYLSEDWAFCNRARQLGFGVWMDQSIVLVHMGLYPYSVADLNEARVASDPGLPSTGVDQVRIQGAPEEHADPLLATLLEDIAEWAGEDLGDVRRMVAQGSADTSRLFETKPEGEGEAEWYRREDVGLAYICDLASWHLRGYGDWPSFAGDLSGKHVLDFGSGISTFALIAARDGARVNAIEPNPVMREFAAWRAAKHGIRLGVLDREPEQLLAQYDAIVAWHVFEHLEEPEGTLDVLLTRLRPGGRLITESGFDDHGPAQHHGHPDWRGALRSRGLAEVSPMVWVRAAESASSSEAAG